MPRVFLIVIATLAACKPTPNVTETKGLSFEDPKKWGLTYFLYNKDIPICLTQYETFASMDEPLNSPSTEETGPATQDQESTPAGFYFDYPISQNKKVDINQKKLKLQQAFSKWMQPLEELSGESFASKLRILTKEDGCKPTSRDRQYENPNTHLAYASVTYKANNIISNTYIHKPGGTAINMNPEKDESLDTSTLLHELGHALGLADTYTLGGTNKPGQPVSIMNCIYKGEKQNQTIPILDLTDDDKKNISYVFCRINYNRVPACDAIIKGDNFSNHMTPNITEDGKNVYSLGVNVKAHTFTDNYNEKIQGLLVTKVKPGSPADKGEIKVGDLITDVGNIKVQTTDDLIDTLKYTHNATSIEMTVFKKSLNNYDFPLIKFGGLAEQNNGTIAQGHEVIVVNDTPLKVQSDTLATILKGSVLKVLDKKDKWLWVEYNGQKGYIIQSDVNRL